MDDNLKEPLPFLPPPPNFNDNSQKDLKGSAGFPSFPVPTGNQNAPANDFTLTFPEPKKQEIAWEQRMKGLEKQAEKEEESKKALQEQIKTLEKKLEEEKQQSLILAVRTEEEKKRSVEVENSLRTMQEKLRNDKRLQELEETRKKAEEQVVLLERRLSQERETWLETLKNQLSQKEVQEHSLEERWNEQRKQLEADLQRDKQNWQKLLQAKEEELANLSNQKQLEEEKIRGEAERRIADLSAGIKHFEQKIELNEKKQFTEKENFLRRLKSLEEENMAIKAQLSLSQSQLNAEIKQLREEKRVLENTWQEKIIVEKKRREEKEKEQEKLIALEKEKLAQKLGLGEEKIKNLEQEILELEELKKNQQVQLEEMKEKENKDKIGRMELIHSCEERLKEWQNLNQLKEAGFRQETEKLKLAQQHLFAEKDREFEVLKKESENRFSQLHQRVAEREEKINLLSGELTQLNERVRNKEEMLVKQKTELLQEKEVIRQKLSQDLTIEKKRSEDLSKEVTRLIEEKGVWQKAWEEISLKVENWEKQQALERELLAVKERKIVQLQSQMEKVEQREVFELKSRDEKIAELLNTLQNDQLSLTEINKKLEEERKLRESERQLAQEKEKITAQLAEQIKEKNQILNTQTQGWENKIKQLSVEWEMKYKAKENALLSKDEKINVLQNDLAKTVEEVKSKELEKETEISQLVLWTEEELKELNDKLERERLVWQGIINKHQDAEMANKNRVEELLEILNETKDKLKDLETEKNQLEIFFEENKANIAAEKKDWEQELMGLKSSFLKKEEEYQNFLREKEILLKTGEEKKSEETERLLQQIREKESLFARQKEQIEQLQKMLQEKEQKNEELKDETQREFDQKTQLQRYVFEKEKNELQQNIYRLQTEGDQRNLGFQQFQQNTELRLENLKNQHSQEQRRLEDNLRGKDEEIKLLRNSLKEKESLFYGLQDKKEEIMQQLKQEYESKLNEKERILSEQKRILEQQIMAKDREWKEDRRNFEIKLNEKDEKINYLQNNFTQRETEHLAKQIDKQTLCLEKNLSSEAAAYEKINYQLKDLEQKILTGGAAEPGSIIRRAWRCLNRTVIFVRLPGSGRRKN
ncbi:MAG: hypothetical protein ABII74_08200 [Elusimicrobiota bacterium]